MLVAIVQSSSLTETAVCDRQLCWTLITKLIKLSVIEIILYVPYFIIEHN